MVMVGRADHDIYNPLPSFRMPGGMDSGTLDKVKNDVIGYVSDIRFHRSFMLSPNPEKGRYGSIRVTYADAGYHGGDPEEEEEEGSGGDDDDDNGQGKEKEKEEIPVMLYIGGMFAGRYQALTVDEKAKDYKIRILFVDRPGIGGTQKVPLDQRVSTWLDLVPALLKHVGVKHVALGSHSAGAIYLMNTLLHLREILHPRKPYVAFFGPWVHPSITGVANSSIATRLPNSMIGSFHHLIKFINLNVSPMFSFSGNMVDSMSSGISVPFRKPVQQTQECVKHEEKAAWQRASEALMTKYIFTEDAEGGGQEALFCLKKGDKLWGQWEDYDRAVAMLANNETERAAAAARKAETDPDRSGGSTGHDRQGEAKDKKKKLLVHVFFASYDEMIGKKGKVYFENCWREKSRGKQVNFEAFVFPDTTHNGVCNPDKGCFDRFFEEIAKVRGGEVEGISR